MELLPSALIPVVNPVPLFWVIDITPLIAISTNTVATAPLTIPGAVNAVVALGQNLPKISIWYKNYVGGKAVELDMVPTKEPLIFGSFNITEFPILIADPDKIAVGWVPSVQIEGNINSW